MTDGSKEQLNMTAGLDIGDNYSYLCLIDTLSGEFMEEGLLCAQPRGLQETLLLRGAANSALAKCAFSWK
jgi:hypothetical protein